jgi:hypothetical protein
MEAQPLLALTVLRHHLVHFVPECVGVIGVMQVTELVNGDVVDDLPDLPVMISLSSQISLCRSTGFSLRSRDSVPNSDALDNIPRLNPIDDLHPLHDRTEYGITRVEMRLRRVRDEEL